MKFKFASAAPSEPTVFGAQRPGYDYHSVGQDMIVEWTDFMQANGIRRVCCLLPKEQLGFYGTDLLASYRELFGNQNVCHVEVQDLQLIDLLDHSMNAMRDGLQKDESPATLARFVIAEIVERDHGDSERTKYLAGVLSGRIT